MRGFFNPRTVLSFVFSTVFVAGFAAAAEAQTVSSLTLVSADTDKDISQIGNNGVINYSTLPTRNLSIRANTSPATVGSVTFNLDNGALTNTENRAPYSIIGDNSGAYYAWTPSVGSHTLTVRAYSGASASGTAGATYTINFTVTNGTAPAATAAPTPVPPAPVVVKPTQLTSILSNPDMGWYSTDKVVSSGMDAQGFPIKVAYVKYYWKDLETGDGVFNWGPIDGNLNSAKAAGQKLALRIVVSDNMQSAPSWLRNEGVPGFVYSTPADGGNTNLWVPNFDNATALSKHFAFLDALAARYNGNPAVASLDIGTVGLWGEWHFFDTSPSVPMPSTTTLHKIIDRYVADFTKTPLVQQITVQESMTYAVNKGVGVRADCLGSWNNLMPYMYDPNFAAGNNANAWKKAPILFEACGSISSWISQGFSVRQIFDWALAKHVTGFNNKNVTVPSSAVPEVDRLLTMMGYRFVVRQLSHPASVKAGASFTLALNVENVGVAPCYGNYNLAVQLRNSAGTVVWSTTTPTTVKGWLPGLLEADQTITVPTSVAAGTYTMAIALVDSTGTPKIQFASSGKDSKGWYPYSSITVN
jgi:hypothetical protein